jgi:hypothetical protein
MSRLHSEVDLTRKLPANGSSSRDTRCHELTRIPLCNKPVWNIHVAPTAPKRCAPEAVAQVRILSQHTEPAHCRGHWRGHCRGHCCDVSRHRSHLCQVIVRGVRLFLARGLWPDLTRPREDGAVLAVVKADALRVVFDQP